MLRSCILEDLELFRLTVTMVGQQWERLGHPALLTTLEYSKIIILMQQILKMISWSRNSLKEKELTGTIRFSPPHLRNPTRLQQAEVLTKAITFFPLDRKSTRLNSS